MRLVKHFAVVAALATAAAGAAQAGDTGRKLEPKFGFNAALRLMDGGPKKASGLLKFRQPVDENAIVFLDTTLRHLVPNRAYYLERGADTAVDGNCPPDTATAAWLRLGQGAVPDAINVNIKGNGRVVLFRELPATAIGVTFDIQFRVVDAITGAIVLRSACYQFTARR
jgi:hypothetical protein